MLFSIFVGERLDFKIVGELLVGLLLNFADGKVRAKQIGLLLFVTKAGGKSAVAASVTLATPKKRGGEKECFMRDDG